MDSSQAPPRSSPRKAPQGANGDFFALPETLEDFPQVYSCAGVAANDHDDSGPLFFLIIRSLKSTGVRLFQSSISQPLEENSLKKSPGFKKNIYSYGWFHAASLN